MNFRLRELTQFNIQVDLWRHFRVLSLKIHSFQALRFADEMQNLSLRPGLIMQKRGSLYLIVTIVVKMHSAGDFYDSDAGL